MHWVLGSTYQVLHDTSPKILPFPLDAFKKLIKPVLHDKIHGIKPFPEEFPIFMLPLETTGAVCNRTQGQRASIPSNLGPYSYHAPFFNPLLPSTNQIDPRFRDPPALKEPEILTPIRMPEKNRY